MPFPLKISCFGAFTTKSTYLPCTLRRHHPVYAVIRTLGLINTFWVYVIPGMLGVYYMLILVNFFQSIPKSLYESAWLDGAGDISVFFRIALPLSKASLATVALFYAVGQWNSWMDSVYYVTKPELRPMAYMMMQIVNKFASAEAVTNAQTMGYAASAMESTTTSCRWRQWLPVWSRS